MMSRVKPGYLTDFNAFFTCSSETDISAAYACRARGKPRARAQQAKWQSSLSVLVIHLVANLIFVSAKGARRLLASFCYKVWVCQSDQVRYFALIGLAGSLSRKIRSESPGNLNTRSRFEVRK